MGACSVWLHLDSTEEKQKLGPVGCSEFLLGNAAHFQARIQEVYRSMLMMIVMIYIIYNYIYMIMIDYDEMMIVDGI